MRLPSNCSFQVFKDFEYEWSMPGDYWDVIRLSMLCGCVSDWEALYGTIFQ